MKNINLFDFRKGLFVRIPLRSKTVTYFKSCQRLFKNIRGNHS